MKGRVGRILLCGAAGLLLETCVVAAQDHPGVEAKAGQAHVVVYRPLHRMDSRHIKPSVYIDGKEAAYMYRGRFFTLALSPGKHKISSSDEQKFAMLDAQPGVTYYARVLASGKWVLAWFKVEQVDTKLAHKELARLRPADLDHVVAPEIVSIGAIAGQ